MEECGDSRGTSARLIFKSCDNRAALCEEGAATVISHLSVVHL